MEPQPSSASAGVIQAMIFRGPLRAFAYPQFRLLWGASLLSIVSFFMLLIARGWLVLNMTDSPFLVTAVNAVPMIPLALVAPFGGVVADRVNRRLILIVGESANLLIVAALALLVITDLVEVWHVFLLSFFHGALFALVMPARMAVVPDLMSPRDLASGVALFTTIFSTAQLAGPAPAGYLINAFGMGAAFLVAALMLLPAIGVLLLLRIPGHAAEGAGAMQESVMASVLGGLAYVRRQPFIFGLILLGVVFAVFGMPYQAILPVFARDVLDSGADGLGLLGLAVGVGALSGSITVASFSSVRQIRFLMIGGGLGFGVLIVFFALSNLFWLSFGLTVVLGFMMQVSLTSNFTLVQLASPGYVRGRVLSIRMLAVGVGPVGMFLLGIGAEQIGPPTALALMGAMSVLLTALVVLAIPAVRKAEIEVESQSPGSEEEPFPASASSAGDD